MSVGPVTGAGGQGGGSGGGGGRGRPSESGGGFREHVLPTAQSILWNPTTATAVPRRGPGGAFPVFLEQQAIAAVAAHHQAAGKQGMMGFLVGDICRCPTTQVKYVIVDSTVRLNQAVYGDKTLVIISRLWDRLQEELRRSEGHLIGWYHSHPPIAVELAPGDVETHMQYFTRPWHTALVVGNDREGPVAGLFRPGPGDTWPTVSLPFYELIDDPKRISQGIKTSILPWQNFSTDDPGVSRGGSGDMPAVPGLVPSRSTLEVVAATGGTGTSGRASVTQPRQVVASPPPEPPKPPSTAAPPPRSQRPSATPARPPVAPPQSATPAPPAGKPLPPGKRTTSPKPPPGALSNLPLLSVGGYDVGPVEIRPSDPRVMTPHPQPAVPVPARRGKEKPGSAADAGVDEAAAVAAARPSAASRRASAAAPSPKPEQHWFATVTVVVLVMLGAAAWYFLLGPGRGQLAGLRGGGGSRSGGNAATTPPPPGSAAPGVPSSPGAVPVDSAVQRFDRLADSVTVAVRGYEDRAKLFGSRQLGCTGLSHGLVTVEDLWTNYNKGKKKTPPLDATRTARDQTLYTAVDSVERHYDRSRCERP